MKLIRIGVDLAKSVFQVHGVDRFENPVWRKKLHRADWLNAIREHIMPGGEIDRIAAEDPVAKRLQQLRGVGPITATALVATIGDAMTGDDFGLLR